VGESPSSITEEVKDERDEGGYNNKATAMMLRMTKEEAGTERLEKGKMMSREDKQKAQHKTN
jgi:hypothetical protein